MLKQFIKGFTIMEMAVAIVVLGVLTCMAVPNFVRVVETFRSKEGQQILHSVYQAQISADADIAEGRIASYTLASLDITIPAADNFNAPVLDFDGTGVPPQVLIGGLGYAVYAHINRTTNAYTLYVQGPTGANAIDGRILCSTQVPCQQMRYAPW